jgi:hypothetical protein
MLDRMPVWAHFETILLFEAFLSYFRCQFCSSPTGYHAIIHDDHLIHCETLQYLEIMGNNDDAGIWTTTFREHLCDELKCIEIKSGVYLIEDDVGRFQEFQL